MVPLPPGWLADARSLDSDNRSARACYTGTLAGQRLPEIYNHNPFSSDLHSSRGGADLIEQPALLHHNYGIWCAAGRLSAAIHPRQVALIIAKPHRTRKPRPVE
jgi:hypothetical protein